MAEIEKSSGHRLRVSVVNLVPLRGDAMRVLETGLRW